MANPSGRSAPDPTAQTQRHTGREARAPSRRVACLTIVFHPEIPRVGERAALPELRRKPVTLSRLELLFAPPHGDEGLALADSFVSRQPVQIAQADRELVIDAAPAVGLTLDGRPVAGQERVPLEALERGVLLGLGGRVLVLLHTIPWPGAAAAPDLGLVGESAPIQALREEIRAAAALAAPVLLLGETGTGKELVARALHAQSARARRPLVSVNLGAIPRDLAASELFGHKKGAFSGALQQHDGYFGRAHGGTLFLDEVGELPEALQPLVLRALESGEIQPVGAGETRRVDVRVVAATDLDLEEAIREGRFRAPLYHRLAGYVIRVPALRERREDIGRLLAWALLQKGDAEGLDTGLFCAAFARALDHAWPGNVRELIHAADRLRVQLQLGRGLDRWPALLSEAPPPPSSPGEARQAGPRELDGEALRELLHRHGWKVGQAAAELGVTRKTLYAAMDRAGLRNAHAIDRQEVESALAQAGGDLERAAGTLELSKRALLLRMKQLGMEG